MTDVYNRVTADLRGGPPSFPDELRHPEVSGTDDKVKICYYGGYEHFERDPDDDSGVYRWIGRTRVAE